MTISSTGAARNNRSGFTLLEVLVTVGLVALIMTLAVGRLNRATDRDLRMAARKLGSTVHLLYNKAVMEGAQIRLVISLEDRAYWAERADEGRPLLKGDEKEEGDFSKEGLSLLRKTELPKKVFFKDVFAEHQSGPISEGKAYVYFFPQGYAERAVINLRDAKDESHFSVSVAPLTGEVAIEREYVEMETAR